MRRTSALLATVVAGAISAAGAIAATAPAATPATTPPQLRLDGIGPLKLGMSRAAALATGWLAHPGTGCTLGGKPYPVTYDLNGRKAPRGLGGYVELIGGRVADFYIERGARTATGISPGSSVSLMIRRYRQAGYIASRSYRPEFAGTFVTVQRGGYELIQGYASDDHTLEALAVPFLPTCD